MTDATAETTAETTTGGAPAPVPGATGDPLLRIRGLRKHYGSKPVLSGIDLDVAAHQVVCLIGASGSGKSTLLRCIDLLEEIDDGTIHLWDVELSDPALDADAARRRIGVVFQAYNLFPHLTVLDNITLAPRRVHRKSRREAEDEARELLGRFGLADKAAEYPDRLSGGQQQRAAIVRALATEPELLLLDEITSALDPELVGEVLEVVDELKRRGFTILMATHEMGFARHAADLVCFLDDGVVREYGEPAQIFTEPRDPATRRFLARVLER
jgi:polar amino acid transport system ATP-binding protein